MITKLMGDIVVLYQINTAKSRQRNCGFSMPLPDFFVEK